MSFWATHVVTMAVPMRGNNSYSNQYIDYQIALKYDANRSKSRKTAYSANCSLETREHEVGIASNRKLVHYG